LNSGGKCENVFFFGVAGLMLILNTKVQVQMCWDSKYVFNGVYYLKVKVKQSHYRPEQAQRVLRG
jgi:hypothetical protein